MQKDLAHLSIRRSQSLKNSNHVGALKNNDKQTADHRESSHGKHQTKDYPHVHVEQTEPRKYLRSKFGYLANRIVVAVIVRPRVNLLAQVSAAGVQHREILQAYLNSRTLVIVPLVQLVNGVNIGQDEVFVIFRQMRLEDSGNLKAAHADIVFDIICVDFVAEFQTEHIAHGLRNENLLARLLV